jgi:isopenicillin N synthase-like dioxygenase
LSLSSNSKPNLTTTDLTHRGAFAATVHRVNSNSVRNPRGRISVPFFLLPSLDIPLEPVPLEKIPPELQRYVGQADSLKTDVNKGWNGSVVNRADRWIENRLRQNPLVGREHWPELWQQYKYDI